MRPAQFATALILLGSARALGGEEPSELGFAKSLVARVEDFGRITGIAQSPPDEVVIAGPRGALRIDAEGAVRARVEFEVPQATEAQPLRRPHHVEPVFEKGAWHYLSRGGNWHEVGWFGPAGERVWSYGGGPGPNWLTRADIDGDGAADHLVGMNGGGGLLRLDAKGEQIWKVREGNVWRVETLQADDDAALEIAHSNAEGELWLRDSDGQRTRRVESASYFARGWAVWRAAGVADRLVVAEGASLRAIGPQGGPKRYAATLSRELHNLAVAQGEQFLAAVSDRAGAPGISLLTIHEAADGALLHEEVLPSRCTAIAWIEAPKPELWVGCDSELWRYRAQRGQARTLEGDAFLASGNLWGPLDRGMSLEQAQVRLSLRSGVQCGNEDCTAFSLDLGSRRYLLIPEFEEGALALVYVVGPPTDPAEWDRELRLDFDAIAREWFAEAKPPFPVRPAHAIAEGDEVLAQYSHELAGREASLLVIASDVDGAREVGVVATFAPRPDDAAAASPRRE